MKTLDQMLDELQEKVGSMYTGIHDLDDEGKKRREKQITDGLAVVRKWLGPDRMNEVEQRLNELEPKVRVVQPRQMNSNESVRDVDAHDLERYYLLKKLLQG